jgi:hypothetical protein
MNGGNTSSAISPMLPSTTSIPVLPIDLQSGGKKKKTVSKKSKKGGAPAMPSIDNIPSVGSIPILPIDLQSGGKKKKTVSKKSKKGGALIDDVKGLAVPFAILLAKQGLDMAFNKKDKTDKTDKADKTVKTVKTAKTASSLSRRKTVSGGGCDKGCEKKGGSIKNKFEKLSKEIDAFLKKY